MSKRRFLHVGAMGAFAVGLFAAAPGCSWNAGTDNEAVGLESGAPLPVRRGTVLIDGCVLDPWESSALASPAMRKLVQEVVMRCLAPRLDGTVGPRDASARALVASNAATLKGLGYRFDLAVTFVDETGDRYDGDQTALWLSDPNWRSTMVSTLGDELAAIPGVDGVDLDIQLVPDSAMDSITALVSELDPAIRPARSLAVFVPPSIAEPSDIPGGNAFSRPALAAHADRLRVMTLDFSIATPGGGPTIDPGWAVDAARLAKTEAPVIDVAYPLYGTDFGPHGTRFVSFLEGNGIAESTGAPIARGPTGAPFVVSSNAEGELHETWWDDAQSTGQGLAAWSFDVLPPDVGVVYYGLGAEDPTLWDRLAARTP